MYVLRLPSVTTWTQSSFRVVMGHLHSAPERLVPGCKFWSSGAPTSNLLSKHKQERKKNDGVNISSKYGRASGRVCTFFFSFLFSCTSVYIHPSSNDQKEAHAWKGKSESLHRQTHCAKRLSSSISVQWMLPRGRKRDGLHYYFNTARSRNIIPIPTTKEGPGKKRYHDLQLCNSDEQIVQRHL